MTDRTCGNCRFFQPEESGTGDDAGDCLSMASGRVKTSSQRSCGAHAHHRLSDATLHEPIAEEV